MRFFLVRLLALCLILLPAAAAPVWGAIDASLSDDELPVPERLMNEDSIYALAFTNPEMGRRVIAEFRSRNLMDALQIDMLEGDFHHNCGKMALAHDLFRRALGEAIAAQDTASTMNLYYRMALVSETLNQPKQQIVYLDSLRSLATLTGDDEMQSRALGLTAVIIYWQESQEQGIRLMREAIEYGERAVPEAGDPYINIQLQEQYCMLATFLADRKCYKECVPVLEGCQKYMNACQQFLSPDEYDAVAKVYYAVGAHVYQEVGNEAKATELFEAWNTVDVPSNSDFMICEYLADKGNYQRALALVDELVPILEEQGQLYSSSMEVLLRSKVQSLEGLGRRQELPEAYHQLLMVADSVRAQQQAAASLEYGIRYDSEVLNMKLEVEHAQNVMQQVASQRLWLALAVAVLIIVFVVVFSLMRHRRAQLYQRLAQSDAMTGLYNRYGGTTRITKKLEDKEEGFLMVIDLDKFKQVNDSLGHNVGDQYLIAISQVLHESFPSDIALRLGGDEFAVFLSKSQHKSLGVIRSEMDQFFAKLVRLEVPRIPGTEISVSAGIASTQEAQHPTFDRLYHIADQRLYQAKKHEGSALVWED